MGQEDNDFFPEVYSGVAAPGDRDEYSVDRLAKKHGVEGELTVEEVYELPLSVLRTLDLRGKALDYRHRDISIGRIIDQRFKDGRDLSIDFQFNKTPLGRMVKAAVESGKMLGLSLTTHEKINTQTGDISVTPIHVAVCYEGARDRTWIESKVDASGHKYTCVHASDEKAGAICNTECSHTCRRFVVRLLHASNDTMNVPPANAPTQVPQTQAQANSDSVPATSSSSAASSSSTSSTASAPTQSAPPLQAAPPPQQQPAPVPQAATQAPPPPAPAAPVAQGSLASFGQGLAPPMQSPAMYPPMWPYMAPMTWPSNPYGVPPSNMNYNPFQYAQPPAPFYGYPQAPPPPPPPPSSSASTSSATPPRESAAASSAVSESKGKTVTELLEEQLRPYKEQIALLFEQQGRDPRRPFSSAAKAPPGTESAWKGPAEKSPEMLMVRASKEYKQFMENEAVEESDETGMWYRLKKPERVDPRAWGDNSEWVSIQSIDAENTARTKTTFDTLVYGREKEGGTYEQVVVYANAT